ncbi:acyl carrier protein [Bacillus coahuilensis p1.1.43]|uniref:Acyl carrier protein n=1 Tax=Bacillus coahuilensis p1.1.43 TaxID=1150625 RepID=A0A147K7L9_9BACI|nr:petrobactin biosynthesis protein AsbD [Bacillus coahuilensis]KUP06133.1 acyl carrier protein [Bacillus coahuilensis p1.1.43]
MSRKQLLSLLYDIMNTQMELSAIESFSEEARLNEDLYLDSIMLLELLLHLEMEGGFQIPDEDIKPKNFQTVGSLVDFLLAKQEVTG